MSGLAIAVLIALISLLLVELFLRLPLIASARAVLASARRAGRILGRRRASDRWKERASRILALRMLRGALALAASLAVLLAAGAALLWSAERIAPGTGRAMFGLPGLLLSLAVACGYAIGRGRLARR